MLEERAEALRAFNRFHTNWVGALDNGLHGTPWSLPEARVIWELGHAGGSAEVATLRGALGLDAGYLSRLLAKLEDAGVIARERSQADARRQIAKLSAKGRAAFATLDKRSAKEALAALKALPEPDQQRLIGALGEARAILGDRTAATRTVVLRSPRPGELGWIVARHGSLYFQEYGWGLGFERLIARVIADYAEQHDPAREAVWIAEVDGAPAGSVMCLADDEQTARLRLLLVEPSARGLGVGTRLVEECIAFARRAGYEKLVLWTNGPLAAARRIYDRLGFVETAAEEHGDFGPRVLGQTLELRL
ncbi:MAG TPA: helix-turn-helix domain-containing GNAT family N-acetyltransferase [Solirubrobacteraceae bacterium]